MRCSTISAALLLAALASACAGTSIVPPLSRDIGTPPATLTEVETPRWRPGESALVVARREQQAKQEANYRICSGREEWRATREAFLAGAKQLPPEERADFKRCDRARPVHKNKRRK
jgi:hypothetical protein